MEQEKDYSLLRPFDLKAAKDGDAIDDTFGGRVVFVDGPDAGGKYAVRIDGHFAAVLGENLRMAPLCWVEGRPVYPGDVLYDKEYGTRQVVRCAGPHDTLETDQPRSDGAFIICLEDATWTPPKVKREGWVNIYQNTLVYMYSSKTAADNCATTERIACVRIEWEE